MTKKIATVSGRFACERCRTLFDLEDESCLECPHCDGQLEPSQLQDEDEPEEDDEE